MKKTAFLSFALFLGMLAIAQSPLDTLLLKAVKSNNLDSVKSLVQLGANVNYCDSNQAPIVMWAALKGDLEMVKYLVENGADVKKKGIIDNTYGRLLGRYIFGNITGIAIVRKDFELVKYLIEECGIDINDIELNPETMTETGWDLFEYALCVKDTIIIKYLTENGVIIRDIFPLLYSSMPEEFLLKCNIIDSLNFRKKDHNGKTVLMEAILRGYNKISKTLITNTSNPVDLNIKDNEGRNILYYAVYMQNVTLIKEILNKRINIKNKDNKGRAAIFLALNGGNIRIIKLLIEAGIDLTEADDKGITPLMYAIQKRNSSEVIDLLISNNVNHLDDQDNEGRTALFYAIDNNDLGTIKLLIQHGTSLNIKDNEGYVPLYYSVFKGKPVIARILLHNGASLQNPPDNCENIFELARRRHFNNLLYNEKDNDTLASVKVKKPKVVIPKGHTGAIHHMAISKDGNLLATSANDQTIIIWDINSGKEIWKIETGYRWIENISFSNDNNYLLFSEQFDRITLWDIDANKEINKIPFYSLAIDAVSFCDEDQSALISGSAPDSRMSFTIEKGITEDDSLLNRNLLMNKSLIGIFDFEQNKLMNQLVYNGQIKGAVYSNINKNVFFCTEEGRIISWDLITDNQRIIFSDTSKYFRQISISPNGKSLLTTTNQGDLFIYSLTDGDVIRKISNVRSYWVKPVFEENSDAIIYIAFKDNDEGRSYSVRKIMIDSGKIENLMNFSQNKLSSCYIFPLKSFILSNKNWQSGELYIYDYKNGKVEKDLHGFVSPIINLDVSDDQDTICLITDFKFMTIPLNGYLPKDYDYPGINKITSGSIDIAANSILLYDTDSVLTYHQLFNDSIVERFNYSSREELVLFKKLQNDTTILLCEKHPLSSYNGTNKIGKYRWFNRIQISLLSLENGNRDNLIDSLIITLKQRDGSRTTTNCDVDVITPSINKNIALFAGGSHTSFFENQVTGENIRITFLYLFDIINKNTTHVFEGHLAPVTSAIFDSDEREILSGDDAGFVILWDIETTSPIFNLQVSESWSGVYSLCLIPNTKIALCGLENGKIVLVNLEKEEVIAILAGHSSKVKKIIVDNKGKFGYSYSDDYTIKIWDLESQAELASIVILDDGEWVVHTPAGLFDASPGAMDKLYYVAGMETIDLEQLKHRYYQPGLLPILLGYSDEKIREVPPFDYVRLFPEKELKIENGKLKIDLTNQGGGIGKVSVFIDNIEIIKDARPQGDADSSRYEITISLDLDEYTRYYRYDTTNVIKVVAWNAEGYLSSRPDTVHYCPSSKTAKGIDLVLPERTSSKPHLYGLIIGTSDYAGSMIDLQYAAKDAEAFYHALSLGANRLFGKENVSVYLLSTDIPGQEPSQENIYKQLMDMRQAGPDDIVVLYFSGHGINYGGQDGEFYYLTMTADGADAAYLNDPFIRSRRTISSSELAIELNQIPARKKVLILDACSSGQAANNLLASLKDIPSSQKRALEFTQDATGSFILASSAANSVSYETSLYGQGLLTYALLKGMRGGQLKKIEEGEFIDVEQLLQYAKSEVPALAKSVSGIQEPIFRNPSGTSFIIGQMTEEDKEKIKLAESLPIFIPSKFTNQDLEQADINLEEMLNARLDLLSAKGTDAGFQFIQNTNYPDAYQITGNYSRKGKKIEVTYILKKGDGKIGGLQKETGNPDHLDDIVKGIIGNVKGIVSGK